MCSRLSAPLTKRPIKLHPPTQPYETSLSHSAQDRCRVIIERWKCIRKEVMFKHKCQCSRQRGEETARGNAVAHTPPTQEQISCIAQYISFRQREQSSSMQKHWWMCKHVCSHTRTFSRHVFDVTQQCLPGLHSDF